MNLTAYYKTSRKFGWGIAISNAFAFFVTLVIFLGAVGMNPGAVPADKFYYVFYGHIVPYIFFVIIFFMMLSMQYVRYILFTLIIYALLNQGDILSIRAFSVLNQVHGVVFYTTLILGIINVLTTLSLIVMIFLGLKTFRQYKVSRCHVVKPFVFYLSAVSAFFLKCIAYYPKAWSLVFGIIAIVMFGVMIGDLALSIKAKN